MIPARIYSVGISYEEYKNDEHFQSSMKFLERNSGRFYWRFKTSFEGEVPPLKVELLDGETLVKLFEDNTSTPRGIFQKSTDGGSTWTAWNDADKTNETTYYRYTFRSGKVTINNRKVRAILSIY
jgi:hypothetical protein